MNVYVQFLIAIVLCSSVSSVVQDSKKITSPYDNLKIVKKRRELDEEHLLSLNKLLQPEDNELFFSENDISLLNSQKKETLREKYNKRMEFLHCQNAYILKYFERKIIDGLILCDGRPDPNKIDEFKVYLSYVENMLSILYYNRIKASKWIITIYMQLLAVVTENHIVLNKYFFSSGSLFRDIDTFYMDCAQKKLVPDIKMFNTNNFKNNEIKILVEYLYDNEKFKNMYSSTLFTLDNITLQFVMENFQEVIFLTSISNMYDWSDVKDLMDNFKTKVTNIYFNGIWALEPYAVFQFHWKIQQIIYTHFLLHISFHLNVFRKESGLKFFVGSESFVSDIQEQYKDVNVKELWQSLGEPLKKIIKFLDYNDNIFNEILKLCERDHPKWSSLAKLDYQVKLMVARCNIELKNAEDKNIIAKNRAILRNYVYFEDWKIKKNIDNLSQYLSKMTKLFERIGGNIFYFKFLVEDYLSKFSNQFMPLDVIYSSDAFFYEPENKKD
ncbi:uncharacterized protein LOC126899274 isoform X2 [Daktulosphaira vitifoliae]|uniref:uncharacterized protein LOC126899274 isoform X2 n=1 Tax=Daktulosphaira vitifoliae TaxID=58002 RepID=UPI0021AAB272|nr:uncharacterized protein LOC126899274 isoform X2 [Daktulosphaira vitifoliae]